MRILITSAYSLPHLGGVEVAVDAFARELTARGHEVVHVASTARRRDEPESGEPQPPYRLVRVSALNPLEGSLGVPYPLFAPWSLTATLRREVARADVVHAHGYLYPLSAIALGLAQRAAHRPVRVLTEHVAQVPYDSRVLTRLQTIAAETIGRWCARTAETLVVLNEKVDSEMARLSAVRERQLIPNGVDARRLRPASEEERSTLRCALGWDERPRALFVGRLVARKGVDAALGAADLDPDLRLVVVGPGRLSRRPPANVQVMGALSPSRLAEIYRAADVFVLPSRGEGFPVTVQEAMASGLPVVVGASEPYAAQLRQAGAGVRLSASRPEAVLAALRPLVLDPQARAVAATQALDHAREHFSWEATVARHLQLYEELHARR